ncbi:DUF6177 family protein [Propionicicella superfundia]|uniref:DUF6177 family protein n=1 Tax=Propionicicella superfundia TaxID=348582 RepID=UPI0004911165|nr:DUF6177 family protein [Propionicicella superfundia]
MVAAVHPLADEWTDEYALRVVDHDRVVYSRPLWHFLGDCRASRTRPVLLTGPGATISPHLYAAMAESGAMWAFRDEQGVFDARSGQAVRAIPELWARRVGGPGHAPVNTDSPVVPAVFFDIYAGDRATDDTVVGPLADHAVSLLGGSRLVRFGRDEPLTSGWGHRALTVLAQQQMPAADPILAATDAGAWASLTVARTRDGLIERVHGGVPLPHLARLPRAQLRERVMPQVTHMLAGLVSGFRPRVALVTTGMLHQVDGRYGYRAGAWPVDAPVAVLIGPRAVRTLRLDAAGLSQRHDVTVLGPGRVPSVLVRMSGSDPLWAQLRAFAFDLDQERLGALLATELQGWS